MIYDGHCHVASTRFIPDSFLADVASNMTRRLTAEGIKADHARLLAALVAQNQDHHADQLVAEMAQAGVDRAVLLIPDFSRRLHAAPRPAEMLKAHHEIARRHPGRFWIFPGVDPRHGPDAAQALSHMAASGQCHGIKVYPPCGFSPSDPSMYPFYEVCRAHRLPVFIHTGPTAGSLDFAPAHPLEADRAARDFPDVVFILGHGGVTHVDICGYMAAYRPNVYLDIGGFAGAPVPGGWAAHLNRLFHMGLNHKILFGTDWPLNRMSGGMNRLVREVVDGEQVFAGVRKRERELILGGNLERVIGGDA